MQSRKGSGVEALANVAIGYGIAVGAQMVIFPLFDVHLQHSQHFLMGGLFTIVSLVRSYVLRRVFNQLHIKGVLK